MLPLLKTDVQRGAELSDDGVYRFSLTRAWRKPPACIGGSVMWIGHNPSSADAETDDPTVRRMMQFSDTWGYGRMSIVNLLPVRSSAPHEAHNWFLEDWPDEAWYGKGRLWALLHNAEVILNAELDAAKVVACWGNIAEKISNLAIDVRDSFKRMETPLYVLGLTQGGFPVHPLARGRNRVPLETKPQEWK